MKVKVLWFSLMFILIMSLLGVNFVTQAQNMSTAAKKSLARSVAVTFDDLPITQDGGLTDLAELKVITEKLLSSLKTHKVPVIGFVNESKLQKNNEVEQRTAILRLWLDAGFELGNHTFSHKSLFTTPLKQFQEDLLQGEKITRVLMQERGKKLRYFRHPFLNTGPDLKTKTEFEKFLTQYGYKVAPVTIDNHEWIFARAYSEAKHRGDNASAQRIADLYVPYLEETFEFYEKYSVTLFGREIPQILLLHANQLNADRFDELAQMLKRRGYSFINIDQALADSAYAHQDTYTGPVGISWLQRWAITKGEQFKKEPYLPEYMRQFDNTSASGSNYKNGKH
ncbi:MAG: polysaccharide deacetylase family protein [Acidobacteriota bacterium]